MSAVAGCRARRRALARGAADRAARPARGRAERRGARTSSRTSDGPARERRADHRARARGAPRARWRTVLVERGVDALLVEPGATMTWLTGDLVGQVRAPVRARRARRRRRTSGSCPAFEESKARLAIDAADGPSGAMLSPGTRTSIPYAPLAAALREQRLERSRSSRRCASVFADRLARRVRARAPRVRPAASCSRCAGARTRTSSRSCAARTSSRSSRSARSPRRSRPGSPAPRSARAWSRAHEQLGLRSPWCLSLIGPAAALPARRAQRRRRSRRATCSWSTPARSLHGYQSDTSRTWVVRRDALRRGRARLERRARRAAARRSSAIRPGVAAATSIARARAVIDARGFGRRLPRVHAPPRPRHRHRRPRGSVLRRRQRRRARAGHDALGRARHLPAGTLRRAPRGHRRASPSSGADALRHAGRLGPRVAGMSAAMIPAHDAAPSMPRGAPRCSSRARSSCVELPRPADDALHDRAADRALPVPVLGADPGRAVRARASASTPRSRGLAGRRRARTCRADLAGGAGRGRRAPRRVERVDVAPLVQPRRRGAARASWSARRRPRDERRAEPRGERPTPCCSCAARGAARLAPASGAGASLFYDSTGSRSRLAKTRVESAPASRSRRACAQQAARPTARAVGPRAVRASRSRATSRRSRRCGAYLLSFILPMLLVVMTVMGAFFPAVDLTAGERERQTAETTLLLPVPRAAVHLGKILAVCVAAVLATALNLLGARALRRTPPRMLARGPRDRGRAAGRGAPGDRAAARSSSRSS